MFQSDKACMASNLLILFVFAHHRVNILTNRIVIFYWPKSYYQMKALLGNFRKKFYFISASSMILFIEFMNGDSRESDDCGIGIVQMFIESRANILFDDLQHFKASNYMISAQSLGEKAKIVRLRISYTCGSGGRCNLF